MILIILVVANNEGQIVGGFSNPLHTRMAASSASPPSEISMEDLLREEGIDPDFRSVVSPSELAALLECIKVSLARKACGKSD